MIVAPETPTLSRYLGRQVWLTLHPADLEDAEHLYRWLSSESVYRFLSGLPASREPLERFKEYVQQGASACNLYAWMLRTSDNTPVGYMSVVPCRRKKDEARWGLSVIGPDEVRGTGMGSMAKRMVLEHLFADPATQRVVTWVHRDNKASLRFNMKAGARVTQRCDDDKLRLVITRNAWEQTLTAR